LVDRTDLKLVI